MGIGYQKNYACDGEMHVFGGYNSETNLLISNHEVIKATRFELGNFSNGVHTEVNGDTPDISYAMAIGRAGNDTALIFGGYD